MTFERDLTEVEKGLMQIPGAANVGKCRLKRRCAWHDQEGARRPLHCREVNKRKKGRKLGQR